MIANRLRYLRSKNGLTQDEVAKRVGIATTTYTNYEASNREPNIETLNKLADIFDCSVDYLFGRVNKPYLALFEDLPEEFRKEGVKALEVAKSAVKEGFTAEQLNELLIFLRRLNATK